jgi:hypothetical protein
MKNAGEIAGHRQVHPEVAALVKEAKNQGIDGEFIRQVVASSESDEDTIADLKDLTKKETSVGKLKPLPHRDRVLDPHEENIFEETIAGEHQPQTTV